MSEVIKSYLKAQISRCDKERMNVEGSAYHTLGMERRGYKAALETIQKLEISGQEMDSHILYEHFIRRHELLSNRAFRLEDDSYRIQGRSFFNAAQFIADTILPTKE